MIPLAIVEEPPLSSFFSDDEKGALKGAFPVSSACLTRGFPRGFPSTGEFSDSGGVQRCASPSSFSESAPDDDAETAGPKIADGLGKRTAPNPGRDLQLSHDFPGLR